MKVVNRMSKLALALLAIPAMVLVRLLRPFILVRFGQIASSRIGHFAWNTELYLCERDAAKPTIKTIDLFYYNASICNYQLKKMWDRVLHICSFAKWVDKVNRLLPGFQCHVVPLTSYIYDKKTLLRHMPSHLVFTPKEEQFGKQKLRELCIPDGSSFVCFYARSSSYLNDTHPSNAWDYHNYRDTKINDYVAAVEMLAKRGYFAIRMSAIVNDRLNIDNPKIIDYASTERTEFLDIFLPAKCSFFISDTGGFSALPWVFRRPIAWINYIPLKLMAIGTADDLFIPKRLWLKKERRFLNFQEIFSSRIAGFTLSQQYEKAGIEVVNNTPEEITALTIEMEERLKGTWKSSEEDEQLQQDFVSFYKLTDLDPALVPRIGTEFLRQNRKLLTRDKTLDRQKSEVVV